MPSLNPNQVETIFRDESYEAFLSALPQQSEEISEFIDLFSEKTINGYSDFRTNVYGSYLSESARNPGEPLPPGTMAQGYNYWTACRSEFSEVRTIAAEYLESVLKLGDYAAVQGEIQAKNYAQSVAEYWTDLFAYGGIAVATLAAVPVGPPGMHRRARMYNHALKGEIGAVIAEIPNTDAADPDGSPWFSTTHTRANGLTTSNTFTGKSLGYFNTGSSVSGGNMRLSEANLEQVLLHMENDMPYLADNKFYAAPAPDTLIVSGNLRSLAAQIVDLNEYRMNTPNNDKSVMFRQSKVFGIKNIVVNRFLPDNCWYVGCKGRGLNRVSKKGKPGPVGVDGPVKGTVSNIFIDMNSQTWVRQFFGYWSHWFNEEMDICWFAGSTPITISSTTYRPVAPTAASLVDWEG